MWNKVTKLAGCVLILLLGIACSEKPQETLSTSNPNIQVDLLFEKDGCRIYRFFDEGRPQYFANCPNHSTVSWERW